MAKYIFEERIVLKKGKQRELINAVKAETGLSWPQLSKLVGVSEFTLRVALGKEKTTIATSLLEKLVRLQSKIPASEIPNSIEATLPKGWGQSKGGKISICMNRTDRVRIKIPNKTSSELAEFIGILLGDGHVSRKGIDIALNADVDREYSLFVRSLIKKLFAVEPKVSVKKNCLHVRVNSIMLAKYLGERGLKWGNKILNKATIPGYVAADPQLLSACIRGLTDTDGGVFLKQKGYARAIIEFKNFNSKLLGDFAQALVHLGYTPSSGGSYGKSVRIQKQEEVLRYAREISFSNPKNLARLRAVQNVTRL